MLILTSHLYNSTYKYLFHVLMVGCPLSLSQDLHSTGHSFIIVVSETLKNKGETVVLQSFPSNVDDLSSTLEATPFSSGPGVRSLLYAYKQLPTVAP